MDGIPAEAASHDAINFRASVFPSQQRPNTKCCCINFCAKLLFSRNKFGLIACAAATKDKTDTQHWTLELIAFTYKIVLRNNSMANCSLRGYDVDRPNISIRFRECKLRKRNALARRHENFLNNIRREHLAFGLSVLTAHSRSTLRIKIESFHRQEKKKVQNCEHVFLLPQFISSAIVQ